jgi:hypothetical protein
MALTTEEKDSFRRNNSARQIQIDVRHKARREAIPVRSDEHFLRELFQNVEEEIKESVETLVGGYIKMFQDSAKVPTKKEKSWISETTRNRAKTKSLQFIQFSRLITAIPLDDEIILKMQERLTHTAHDTSSESLIAFERFCQMVKPTTRSLRKATRPAQKVDVYALAKWSKGIQKVKASNGVEYPIFPFQVIPTGRFFVIEEVDVQNEDDLTALILHIYHFPESDFYYYPRRDSRGNRLIEDAHTQNRLLFADYSYSYYKNVKYIKAYDQIHAVPEFELHDWQRELVKSSPEYMKITLRLSEAQKRQLQIQESVQAFRRTESTAPVAFKPKIWGFELDGIKTYRWLKKQWPKVRRIFKRPA